MTARPEAKRVLVVDDDPLMRELFSAVLRRLQLEVACAGNLPEARGKLSVQSTDLILLDVQLGEADGLDFARELTGRGGFENIPMIALSATEDHEIEARARRSGCAGFIPKPIDPRTFGAQLEPYLAPRPEPAGARCARDEDFARMRCDFLGRAVREAAELAARSDADLLADGALAAAAHRWAGASGIDGLPDVVTLARSLENLARKKETSQAGRIRAELALIEAQYQSASCR